MIQIEEFCISSEQVYDMDGLSSSAIYTKFGQTKIYPLSMLCCYHTRCLASHLTRMNDCESISSQGRVSLVLLKDLHDWNEGRINYPFR
jgi:hypothetical protein